MSQKELEKALNESDRPSEIPHFNKMKARIELIGDIDELKKVSELLKETHEKVGLPPTFRQDICYRFVKFSLTVSDCDHLQRSLQQADIL